MLIPENFVFTQHNLQDYVDCNRRFYYREILHLEWPAIESEPVREQEELIQLGTRFHLLCQQYFSGIPAEDIAPLMDDPQLDQWWQHFLKLDLISQEGQKSPEKLVSIPFENFRLTAKFDLLLNHPDGAVTIYDWKTSQHQPQRKTVIDRMQSKVYPLVVSLYLQQKKVTSAPIQMIYWYPAFPDSPISFTYSAAQRSNDQSDIESIIREISQKEESDFSMTLIEKKCAFCRYRSLCERGVSAGVSDQPEIELDQSDAFDLDFEAL